MKLLPVLIAFTFIFGCAAPPEKPPEPEIVWPLPPEKPRIKYLKSYSDTFDVEEAPGFMERVAGVNYYSLEAPQGVAADRQGNIYVADSTRHLIVVFRTEKKKLDFIGDRPGQGVRIPIGITVANNWNMLFVAGAGSKNVVGYDLTSRNQKIVITGFTNPVGVAVDEARGRIYVTDSKASELKVFDQSGKYISTIAKAGVEDNQLFTPGQVSVDRQGNVYVADIFNFKVKVFSPEGKFLRSIGKGVGDALGYFAKLSGVAVDSEGHVYAVDTAFNNVQIFDQEGNLLLFWGYDGIMPGEFRLPMHMYIDEKDRIYVADTFNNRVQVFQFLKE
jgi:sugar lactone lactonase YvrE